MQGLNRPLLALTLAANGALMSRLAWGHQGTGKNSIQRSLRQRSGSALAIQTYLKPSNYRKKFE